MLALAPGAAAAGHGADKASDKKGGTPAGPPPSDSYDVLYARYLESARRTPPAPANGPSIDWIRAWASIAAPASVNDLVTIRVVENIEGAGARRLRARQELEGRGRRDPDVRRREGAAVGDRPDQSRGRVVGHAVQGRRRDDSRSGTLSATITARVMEVLPNGDLVLEGAREIEINGDRQMVVLTGVVRPRDISDQNVVLSPKIGQLRIRYFGRGLMKDNLKPGWLVRVAQQGVLMMRRPSDRSASSRARRSRRRVSVVTLAVRRRRRHDGAPAATSRRCRARRRCR